VRLALAGLLAAFAVSRVARIDSLPAFLDEARHLNWAQRLQTESHFLKPLDDGKLLQVVATAASMRLGGDPLRAARLTSVLVGAVGLWAAWRLGRRLRGPTAGLLSAALYLVCPFMLVYDRMNLADVYLSTCASLALLACLHLLEDPRPARALVLGLAMAASVLSKAPGLAVFVYPAIAAWLLRGRGAHLRRMLGLAYAVAGALVAPPIAYFLLHTSQIQAKAAVGADSRADLLVENLGLAASWLWDYWTGPVVLLGLAAVVWAVLHARREEGVLALASAVWVAPFVLFAWQWFPRYVLPASVPFLVLVALAATDLEATLAKRAPRLRWPVVAVGLALLVAPALAFDARLLLDPATAPWPAPDRFQYVQGWPSGYGWREAYAALRGERQRHPEGITVVTDRTGHRTGQWVLKAYFQADPGVEVRGLEVGEDEALAQVEHWVRGRPLYLLTGPRLMRFAGTPTIRADRVGTYRKPSGAFVCNLYRLVPRTEP
jgi:4-amino-4-deoxy-L-arabinose transferase-like glycosyltransferase